MSTLQKMEFDAVVVGAGTAGSAAAWQLASKGLRVALLEVRRPDAAGPRWVNAVPPWMFDRAGVARPEPPELHSRDCRCSTLGPNGLGRVTLEPGPVWLVDVRRLTARLQGLAFRAGVTVFGHAGLRDLRIVGGRPAALRADLEPGRHHARILELSARLFVDATGIRGALRQMVRELDRHCPPVPPMHVCAAAQEVCEVADREGALAFLERERGRPGEALSRTGVDGGFSTATVTVHEDLNSVELLTGSIAGGWYRAGWQLMRELKAREPWIGRRCFGGAGAIPLRRPYDRLAAPGIALVGDSGCQVFPAHGSGTGSGMIAARMLADAVAHAADIGSLEATWTYQARFQREIGSVHAAYDVIRRAVQREPGESLEALLDAGAIGEATTRAALEQRLPPASPVELVRIALAGLRSPLLVGRFARRLALMAPVSALYRRYPLRPDLDGLRRWSHAAAWLFNEPPDVV